MFSRFVGVASDAGPFGSGFVTFNSTGSPDPNLSGKEKWDEAWVSAAINVRETEAAIRAISQLLLRSPELRDVEIRIAIDNTSAEAWVRRGVCPHPVLEARLNALWDVIEQRNCVLTVIGIDTKHNAADSLSRGDDIIFQGVLMQTLNIVHDEGTHCDLLSDLAQSDLCDFDEEDPEVLEKTNDQGPSDDERIHASWEVLSGCLDRDSYVDKLLTPTSSRKRQRFVEETV